MKMAKASAADLELAVELLGVVNAIHRGNVPAISDDEQDNYFDDDNIDHLRLLHKRIESIGERDHGCLNRVIFGMDVILSSGVLDPDARTLELHPQLAAAEKTMQALQTAKPLEDWNEDYGNCLWWRFPVDEPPYCGHPGDNDFPDYVTHWTPLPPIPTPAEQGDVQGVDQTHQKCSNEACRVHRGETCPKGAMDHKNCPDFQVQQ